MIDFSQDYFALFALPRSYSVDEGALDTAYRKLQSLVHPDRFASAGEPERIRALQASARVNEAYHALKDPVERAQYLLSLKGIDALSETDTSLPLDFLESQLERREAIADAAKQRDSGALDALQREIRAQARELEASLASALDSKMPMSDARTTVRKLKFLSKLVADIDSSYTQIED
jgi:molecular chaperone HscB